MKALQDIAESDSDIEIDGRVDFRGEKRTAKPDEPKNTANIYKKHNDIDTTTPRIYRGDQALPRKRKRNRKHKTPANRIVWTENEVSNKIIIIN